MVTPENNFIEKYIMLQRKIIRASWADEANEWTLVVPNLESGTEFEGNVDIIINGRWCPEQVEVAGH
jgi:hypothetical protein